MKRPCPVCDGWGAWRQDGKPCPPANAVDVTVCLYCRGSGVCTLPTWIKDK